MENNCKTGIEYHLKEIEKYKEKEDFDYFKGYLAGLFAASKINLQVLESYTRKAKIFMGYEGSGKREDK